MFTAPAAYGRKQLPARADPLFPSQLLLLLPSSSCLSSPHRALFAPQLTLLPLWRAPPCLLTQRAHLRRVGASFDFCRLPRKRREAAVEFASIPVIPLSLSLHLS